MPSIVIYSSNSCGYCRAAKSLLQQHGLEFEEINVSQDKEALKDMLERSGRRTVPQIFFGDHHIGGFTELRAHLLEQD